MTRALAFLVHNWPLKLAALVLATLLYGGLVLSENAQVWSGRVPITAEHQPNSVFILGNLGEVQNIRYFAPRDVADRLSQDSFHAYVDLAGVQPQPGGARIPVHVKASDDRVHVLDWDPAQILVQLDPVVSTRVPVQVDKGTAPAGLQVGDPIVDQSEVTVSGPQSYVSQVSAALARVIIQPSGISIDQNVDLVAVDASRQEISQVRIDPGSVHVKIIVGTSLGSRALPVRATVAGTPAVGYEVASVAVSPSVVTVSGQTGVLTELTEVDTAPISISAATSDVSRAVTLDLPEGVAATGDATVKVVVQLQATTGSRVLSLGLTLLGTRSDRGYALSTDHVLVTVGGRDTDLATLAGRTLVGTLDVSSFDPGVHDVPVHMTLPTGVSVLSMAPVRVQVTVSAAPTATPPPPTPSPSGA